MATAERSSVATQTDRGTTRRGNPAAGLLVAGAVAVQEERHVPPHHPGQHRQGRLQRRLLGQPLHGAGGAGRGRGQPVGHQRGLLRVSRNINISALGR